MNSLTHDIIAKEKAYCHLESAAARAVLWQSWHRLTHSPSDHELITRSNTYSPLLDRLTVHMRDVQLRSALLNEHNTPPSIHRQQPSLDVDAAWTYLTHGGRNFLITADEVRKLGKDPERAAYIADAKANGDEKYFAWIQGSHDIHCLDNIRRFMFRDHYYGEELRDPIIEAHFLHCLQTLLLSLQCKYSTDVYLAAWVEDRDAPVIDFNITRRCVDYDDYLHWEPSSQRSHVDFATTAVPPDALRVSQDIV
ncbi:hypothetical protein TgHK011_006999 [Trichoderma gracile]|nr:hypothetical protein TgHK011_006999 [Trichoderma gracile]